MKAKFTISYELLALLQWLSDHEEHTFQKMIDKALASGLNKELQKFNAAPDIPLMTEEIQDSVLDFFTLIESMLIEGIKHHIDTKVRHQNLKLSADRIDSSVCDSEIVQSSLESTAHTVELNPEENPKEVLFKEVLRRWRPHNKAHIN